MHSEEELIEVPTLLFCVWAEEALQSLLECLTCPPFTPTQHLEREQALAKQFAEILHFTLRFDELKVCWAVSITLTHTHTHSALINSVSCRPLFDRCLVFFLSDENSRNPERLQLLQKNHQSKPDKQHEREFGFYTQPGKNDLICYLNSPKIHRFV